MITMSLSFAAAKNNSTSLYEKDQQQHTNIVKRLFLDPFKCCPKPTKKENEENNDQPPQPV